MKKKLRLPSFKGNKNHPEVPPNSNEKSLYTQINKQHLLARMWRKRQANPLLVEGVN